MAGLGVVGRAAFPDHGSVFSWVGRWPCVDPEDRQGQGGASPGSQVSAAEPTAREGGAPPQGGPHRGQATDQAGSLESDPSPPQGLTGVVPSEGHHFASRRKSVALDVVGRNGPLRRKSRHSVLRPSPPSQHGAHPRATGLGQAPGHSPEPHPCLWQTGDVPSRSQKARGALEPQA